jgi:putative glutamine amidotransferase
MDDRPVIGICTSLTEASWSVWKRRAALTPYEYIAAIQRAGGLAVMLPPDPEYDRDADQILDQLDGLILAGGNDIDPAAYGAAPHHTVTETVRQRDDSELALVRRAWERDMPVLGICRGMQLLNVARGGTLLQHLPDEVGHADHRIRPGSFDGADHDVRLDPGSLAAQAAGEEVHVTKSHHHQGIDVVGDGLSVTGHSALGDDLPEAVEAPDHRFVLGVQWHPEADETSTVIGALVEEARTYRSSRGSA